MGQLTISTGAFSMVMLVITRGYVFHSGFGDEVFQTQFVAWPEPIQSSGSGSAAGGPEGRVCPLGSGDLEDLKPVFTPVPFGND